MGIICQPVHWPSIEESGDKELRHVLCNRPGQHATLGSRSYLTRVQPLLANSINLVWLNFIISIIICGHYMPTAHWPGIERVVVVRLVQSAWSTCSIRKQQLQSHRSATLIDELLAGLSVGAPFLLVGQVWCLYHGSTRSTVKPCYSAPRFNANSDIMQWFTGHGIL